MATKPMTPPPLQGPTAKEKKYDRQLRLWAASGQQALEEAHILLLNSSPGVVGVETLKNLILPGIGNYTIVDEEDVVEEDLGINFFLTDESLGKPRANETCRYLTELNPDVNGDPVQRSTHNFLEDPHALDKYSLILFVASPKQSSNDLNRVSQHCLQNSIPLFYIHSIGLFSHFSVQLPDAFPIVDTHPDPVSTQDLRLLQPWPELQAFMKTKTSDLDALSDHDHGHVPYLILLLHFLEEWKSSHDGDPPSEYKEKKEFKAFIESKARKNNSEGGEENFDQAAAAVLKSLNKPSLPSGLAEIFAEATHRKPQTDPANFWLVAAAISNFHADSGALPLPGALPDMKAQSHDYIQLQNIYKTKARRDIEEITKRIRAMEMVLQRETPVENKEIEAFCKGAAFVKLIRGKQLLLDLNTIPTDRAKSLAEKLQEDDESSTLPIYIAFLAYDATCADYISSQTQQPQNPKIQDPQRRHDLSLAFLKMHAETVVTKIFAAGENRIDNHEQKQRILERVGPVLEEIARAEGGELHNISALTGGMVAQEVIKVVTKQYVPVDNTCVFDGIKSASGVFRV
ncbi:MAG: hypothetical protein LQ350_005535 [Teloschistes chrysophthalmus]|nr:MAG: hypothetical protein LQ350_005535 [Niorma chrysophthalma]